MIGQWDRAVRGCLLIAGALFAIFTFCGRAGIRFNASPSLPLGLYIVDPNGPLVEFCPAEPWASLAAERGYRSYGTCPDGATPFLKPIVAQVGDSASVGSDGIRVNGRLLAKTAPLQRDTKGRLLSAWVSVEDVVRQGEVWVASSYSARSFDSRYIGPVRESSIRARVRPLLTLW